MTTTTLTITATADDGTVTTDTFDVTRVLPFMAAALGLGVEGADDNDDILETLGMAVDDAWYAQTVAGAIIAKYGTVEG